ncbi:MAG: CRISPR-associated RAMP protein Csx10 [Cyanophyceae cyanobacterium]
MKRIDLTITAQAPLAIGQRKPGGSVSEAMDYIPGSVIRGAIASRILKSSTQIPKAGDDFHALFLDEQAAVFQNAYPAIAKVGEDEYEIRDGEIAFLPATALSSKTDSGFKPNKAGVFDSLIDSFCAREHGLFYEPNNIKGDRVESFSGFYSKAGNCYSSHSVSKRLLTRVGINRRLATAQEEILYSIEVLNEVQGKKEKVPTTYRSSILVQDDGDLAEQLSEFIRSNCDRFRLGGSGSRGLGNVTIKAKISESANIQESSLKQRIGSFNEKLKERWGFWNAFGVPDPNPLEGRTFFTVNLQSDAILTEQWQRTMVISEDMLRQFVGLHNADVTLHMTYSSYDYRSGWNTAWGLPKDVELIAKMGGVFLFSISETQQERWYEKLAELELRGVGDRTSEGLGQIKVCDDFHLIFREDAV